MNTGLGNFMGIIVMNSNQNLVNQSLPDATNVANIEFYACVIMSIVACRVTCVRGGAKKMQTGGAGT